MNLRLAIALSVAAIQCEAATWFVDLNATGANNGTSTTDAWTDPLSSDRNGSVASGDTVYVKGGDYVSTHGQAWALKEGTAGNITHYYFTNGVAKVYCGVTARQYTELNCGLTNYQTNIFGTYRTDLVTNNCNLWIDRQTNFYGVGPVRSLYCLGEPITVKWVHITGCTNRENSHPEGKSDAAYEVWFNLGDGEAYTNYNELAYYWIDQSSGHGTSGAIGVIPATSPSKYRALEVHHGIIENFYSDVFNFENGVDFHNNIVRNRGNGPYGGSSDTFTIAGLAIHNRIYNNIIEPDDNVLGYFLGNNTNYHDVGFYGNLMTPVHPALYNAAGTMAGPNNLQPDGVGTNTTFHIWSNVFFLNNSYPLSTNAGAPKPIFTMVIPSNKTGSQGVGVLIHSNAFTVKNNLFIEYDNELMQTAWGGGLVGDQFNCYWAYDTNSFVADYNMFWAPNRTRELLISWLASSNNSVTVTNSTQLAAQTGRPHNVSTVSASFVDAANWNFHPASRSVNVGQDLTSLTNLMPDLDKDLEGNTRTNWSAGAIDFRDSGLVLWLTFAQDDGWTTNHVITDRSGYGNHAYYMPSTNRNTWPSWTNGPSGLNAAYFHPTETNGFIYGTYAAIKSVGTNALASGIGSFTNGTWAAWVAVDGEPTEDSMFLSAGQDVNDWNFGKYYNPRPLFMRCETSAQDPHETYAQWPRVDTDTNWYHYAITWDGTNWTPYLNGTNFVWDRSQTNANVGDRTNQWTGTLISTNTLANGVPAWSYIGVGVNTHSNPSEADSGPNNGQLWGRMADVRIYNRALTASEIATLAGTTNSTPPDPTPSGSRILTLNGAVMLLNGNAVLMPP